MALGPPTRACSVPPPEKWHQSAAVGCSAALWSACRSRDTAACWPSRARSAWPCCQPWFYAWTLVRARFAHVHGCESAALTRPCGRCTCVVQDSLPRRRHLGPHNLDPFLGTVTLRVIVSARQHSVQVSMRAHFTPRLACAIFTSHRFLCSSRRCKVPRDRPPAPPPSPPRSRGPRTRCLSRPHFKVS